MVYFVAKTLGEYLFKYNNLYRFNNANIRTSWNTTEFKYNNLYRFNPARITANHAVTLYLNTTICIGSMGLQLFSLTVN